MQHYYSNVDDVGAIAVLVNLVKVFMVVHNVTSLISQLHEIHLCAGSIRNEQIKKRIRTAEELEDEFLLWLSELRYATDDAQYNTLLSQFTDKLEEYVGKTIDAPMYATEFADKVAEETGAYTWARLKKLRETGQLDEDDPYVTSIDRASILAAGVALAIWSHREYLDAYENGYTEKTWVCLMDGKERDTHAQVNGTTIGIDEYFQVGACEMLYPCDYLNGIVEETVNCRCWLEYSGKGKKYDYHESPDDLKDEPESDRMKTAGEVEYEKYHDGWPRASLADILKKYDAELHAENEKKDIYRSKDGKYDIVVDKTHLFFRIMDNSLYGRRKYTDIDGNEMANVLENGAWRGRTKDEYESATHYVNEDFKG